MNVALLQPRGELAKLNASIAQREIDDLDIVIDALVREHDRIEDSTPLSSEPLQSSPARRKYLSAVRKTLVVARKRLAARERKRNYGDDSDFRIVMEVLHSGPENRRILVQVAQGILAKAAQNADQTSKEQAA